MEMTDAQSAQTALDKLIEAVETGAYDAVGKRHRRFNAFCDDWEALRGVHEQPSYTAAWNAYNGSLDAALALHEALLPGHWLGEMGGNRGLDGKNWYAQINHQKGTATFYHDAVSSTPARAWLIAILRAYRSMQP